MNGEKLFKSMNNINQEWIEQAKPANKPVIMRTRSKIYRNIAAAAAAVIAISGLTYTGVYAYQKYLVPKSNVNFESHISGDSSVPAAVSWASVWPRPWAFRATTTRSSR